MTVAAVAVLAVAAAAAVAFTLGNAPASQNGTSPRLAASNTSKVTTSNGGSVPAGASLTTATSVGADAVKLVNQLRASLVALYNSSGTAPATSTAVALPGGTLLLTSISAVGSAKSVEAVTADGRHRTAQVVGADPASGVAVVSVTGGAVSPATFADDDVEPGQLSVAVCLCSAPTGSSPAQPPAPTVAIVSVREVGASAGSNNGGAALIDVIEADAPLGPNPWGGVLLDDQGRVIGILDGTTSSKAGNAGVFIPSPLALGVANELAAAHEIVHGWIGVTAADLTGGCGAVVLAVLPNSPAAAAGLGAGDVIDNINGHKVCSLADLQSRLYVAPPGQVVLVGISTAAGERTVPIALSDAPS
jgi:serine protease Do